MKKTLAILGLLVCTAGFAFADETVVTEDISAQQADMQPQIEKQIPVQKQFNRNNQNKAKLKKFNNQKVDKIGKGDIKGHKFDKKYGNFRLKDHRRYIGHHRHPQNYRAYNHRYHRINTYRNHNGKINNRKAYNRYSRIR